MKSPRCWWLRLLFVALAIAGLPAYQQARAAGVTLITHGLNGDVDGWVSAMADRIPAYYRFPGTNFSTYQMYFFQSNNAYYLTANRVSGGPPSVSESGEIVIKLDWRQLADGDSYDTYQVAAAVAPALLNTNFIPELGGHALVELPMHLIGHSRGGSLICEVARLLGTNGIWIDQLTTLDPHPLNDSGFPLDFLLYSAVDAPAKTYQNVLFHDNYWQNIDTFVYGKSVPGAYVRELVSLNGGYSGVGGAHSDVHLWYHGTLDWRVPASDSEATITDTERSNWWTAYESQGATAGFYYSLIGGGNRLSPDWPTGGSGHAVREGFNQHWDVGAGTSDNRVALTSNNGNWPSLIRFDRGSTNPVVQNETTPVTFYYQWARSNTELAVVTLCLDNDLNPYNSNHVVLQRVDVPGNGAGFVSYLTTNVTLYATNATPGFHPLFTQITGAGQTRYLYAPQWVEVVAPATLVLSVALVDSGHFWLRATGKVGQKIVLQRSTNLVAWLPIATNTLATDHWDTTNVLSNAAEPQLFRALGVP